MADNGDDASDSDADPVTGMTEDYTLASGESELSVDAGLVEIEKALASEAGAPRGASTITQQVAKNLFLWSGRSYVRKGIEAGIALFIEITWSKQRILEVYLNIAQFGDGVYGVEAASWKYFHRPAASLTRQQSALLAAVLPNPLYYRVENPQRFTRQRQKWILSQMRNLGGLRYLEKVEDAS